MNLTISLIGIIVALGLLAFLCFKGVNSLLAAMLSVVIIALSSRFDIVELLTGEYASGLTGFICNQLFLFVMCAVFGKFMEPRFSENSSVTVMRATGSCLPLLS